MSNLYCHLFRHHCRKLLRNYQPARYKFGQGAYEGEGKTTVTILNKDMDYGLMIDKLSLQGFKLNLGFNIFGPMIIFPKTVIGWNIGTVEDINEDSLTIFKVLEPKPDILILGLDKPYPRDAPFINRFKEVAKSLDISHEILLVEKACTTFNFLNAERRYAVAALLPPRQLDDPNWEDMNETALRRMLHEPWIQLKDPALEHPGHKFLELDELMEQMEKKKKSEEPDKPKNTKS